MISSFRGYIEEYYFDKLFDNLKWYVYNNRNKINFKLNKIRYVDQVYLENIYMKKMYISYYSNDKIEMNIVIDTEVTLKEYKYGELYSDTDYPVFIVNCKCDFENTINNFKIISITHDEYLEKSSNLLTDNLIPYIKKDKLEDYAKMILEKYYPEALCGFPVDPRIFAKRLNLTIKESKFKNSNIMGTIFFEDYKIKNNQGKVKMIPANTILISSDASFMGFERSVNFTIIHECVHYILHKKAFQLERLFNKKAKKIECHIDGGGKTDSKATPIDWMEWQANSLAPRLLMPKDPFKKKVSELFDKYQLIIETNDYLDYYGKIMYELADFYGAPIESVKIRLIELGYDFPLGCFIKIDDKNVPHHSFKKDSLFTNETFSISNHDAAKIVFLERYFKKNSLIDAYIYVDAHLCINHPKYIMKNNLGGVTLTNYARRHMDECCLKFVLDVPTEIGHYDISYKTFKMLNRINGNHSELVVNAHDSFNQSSSQNNKEALKEALVYQNELLNKIPRTTKNLFKILKEYSGFTNEELVNILNVSKDTVDKYLYKDDFNYSREIVIRFLLAMNIPYQVSRLVLELCRCSLNISNKDHQLLDYVLSERWRHNFEDNIEFLKNENVFI